MRTPVATLDDGFDQFWAEYPRHVGKKDAQKAWTKIRPTPALLLKILEAVRWQKTTPQWLRDGGDYIPYAGTWLRGERWDDEPFETRPLLGKATSRIAAMLATIKSEGS